MSYVIVTAVRDEEKHVRSVLESVRTQTVPPREWIIVDDGSRDNTGAILDQYAEQISWMRIIHRSDRGYRKSGAGVVEAFYDGYRSLRTTDWDFVVKLDGDLTLQPDYFEKCLAHFRRDSQIGIGGGDIYHNTGMQLKREINPQFHVRGATKMYRRACWQAIGGLWSAPGWDTIDEVKANMLGWRTCTFPELHVLHHRFTGTGDGLLRDRIKHGMACYVSRYHPLFLISSCVRRLLQRPRLAGSLAILYGFLKGYVTRAPRVKDRSYTAYIRAQQLKRLCGMPTIWK
jgi:glycosyltransferase involved in cell wall biosynthesis